MTVVGMVPKDHEFISDSQDVAAVKTLVEGSKGYDAFFVKVCEGEYVSVYGMCGLVPHLNKLVSKLI